MSTPTVPWPNDYRAAVLFHNRADEAGVTASSALPLTPPARVQDQHIGNHWRSMTNADSLLLSWDEPVILDTLGALGLNEAGTLTVHVPNKAQVGLPGSTKVRFRLSLSDPTGVAGEIYDSGPFEVDRLYWRVIALLNTTVSAQYLLIDFENDDEDFCEAGRVVAGIRHPFSINYEYGGSRTIFDPSVRTTSIGGQTRIERRPKAELFELPFGLIETSDRYGFIEEMERVVGLSDDVLVIRQMNSDNPARETLWGLVEDATPAVQVHPDIESKTWRIRGRL